MQRAILAISLFLVLFLTGCAELRLATWQGVNSAAHKGADKAFNVADANKDDKVDRSELDDLVDELLEPIKGIILGE